MALYFECKVKYDKMQENGSVRKVDEPYLVDALTFTEAENRMIEELTPYISGDFSVSAAKKTKIAEVININADKFYLAKLTFITLDEKTGAEKKSITQMLVGPGGFDEAVKTVKDHMKDTMSDWEFYAVEESKIIEVFEYKPLIAAEDKEEGEDEDNNRN